MSRTTHPQQGSPPHDPKDTERYSARAQKLLHQEEKKRNKANVSKVLAWMGLIAATSVVAIPTGSFLSSILTTTALVCYCLAFCIHVFLALSVDGTLYFRWRPSISGMTFFAALTALFVMILAGVAYKRYDAALNDGDMPLSAAGNALFWFFVESMFPIVSGALVAHTSDEAQRRGENCHRFDSFIGHLESNPGRERKSWDTQVADVDREYKEVFRHTPHARRLLAQLSYISNQFKLYHPDRGEEEDNLDDDGDGRGVRSDNPRGLTPDSPSHFSSIHSNKAEHSLTQNRR